MPRRIVALDIVHIAKDVEAVKNLKKYLYEDLKKIVSFRDENIDLDKLTKVGKIIEDIIKLETKELQLINSIT
jgi:hypothetical protein